MSVYVSNPLSLFLMKVKRLYQLYLSESSFIKFVQTIWLQSVDQALTASLFSKESIIGTNPDLPAWETDNHPFISGAMRPRLPNRTSTNS